MAEMVDAEDVYERYKKIKERGGLGISGTIMRHEFYEQVLRLVARIDSFEGEVARAALGQEP